MKYIGVICILIMVVVKTGVAFYHTPFHTIYSSNQIIHKQSSIYKCSQSICYRENGYKKTSKFAHNIDYILKISMMSNSRVR